MRPLSMAYQQAKTAAAARPTGTAREEMHRRWRRDYTLRELARYLGWGDMDPQSVFEFMCERERLLRLCQGLLATHKSVAPTAEEAIRERFDALLRRDQA